MREGEERTLRIDKGSTRELLGISIAGGDGQHGIFVNKVTPSSIAHRYGVAVGDQILEVRFIPISASPPARPECLR